MTLITADEQERVATIKFAYNGFDGSRREKRYCLNAEMLAQGPRGKNSLRAVVAQKILTF